MPVQRLKRLLLGRTVMVLGLVLLWWLKAGFLAPSAAWPAFVAVALVGGVGLGFCLVRR